MILNKQITKKVKNEQMIKESAVAYLLAIKKLLRTFIIGFFINAVLYGLALLENAAKSPGETPESAVAAMMIFTLILWIGESYAHAVIVFKRKRKYKILKHVYNKWG